MTMKKETEYIYSRSKSIILNEEGQHELFLFAGLSMVTTAKEHPTKKSVKMGISELVEELVETADPQLLELSNHDLNAIVSANEYKRLEELAKTNIKEFLLYKPTNDDGEKLEINFFI